VNNPNSLNTVASVPKHTTFSFAATFPNSGCPPIIRSFTAFVEPNPIVDIIPEDTSFCFTNAVRIETDVQPDSFTKYSYAWTPATNLNDPTVKEPMFFSTVAGEFGYKITVTTPVGCTGSDSVLLRARPASPVVNVTKDQVAKYGSEVQLNAEGTIYYTWLPDKYIDFPNIRNPKYTVLDPVTLMVVGMNEWGCKDTAYVRIDVDYSMFEIVPSAFSPNNDGRNDVFRIPNLKYQRLAEFRIFNRWGQEVFSTTDPNAGWDGTYKGVQQQVGVYHYIIRVTTPDGKMKTYKNDVTLLR
jgi:gliding motility-associated-like protein